MRNTKQENIKIKQELKKLYPNYKTSVTQGSGTAGGWKQINIYTDIKEVRNEDGYGFIPEIREAFNVIREKVEEIIRNNSEVGYYYADDGYNTKTEEFMIQISGV